MKKILFITFLLALTIINAQSYVQSRNWETDTILTLKHITDYGVEFNQTGDSVYSFEIKDTKLKIGGTINRINNRID